jgi:hypothetical protein
MRARLVRGGGRGGPWMSTAAAIPLGNYGGSGCVGHDLRGVWVDRQVRWAGRSCMNQDATALFTHEFLQGYAADNIVCFRQHLRPRKCCSVRLL